MTNKSITLAHEAMANVFAQADPHSMGVLKSLMDIYPAFAEKLFHNNKMMQTLVLSNMNPMDILDYPICGRCETLAAGYGTTMKDGQRVKQCKCLVESCGAVTPNPITLREWIFYETKRKVSPEYHAALPYIVDRLAMIYMQKAEKEYEQIDYRINMEHAATLGVYMPDGSMHKVEQQPTITREERSASEVDIEEIKKEIRARYAK